MSQLKINLMHSTNACNYVLKTISKGGANWDQYQNPSSSWETCIKTYGEAACTAKKDSVDICVYEKLRPSYRKALKKSSKSKLEKIRLMADEIIKMKCGNCGEFSSLAFMYLYDKNVRPIEWMALIGADHAFVVIGRNKKSNINNALSWGANAVICDPWGQGFRKNKKTGTYPASNFDANMADLVSFSGVKSLYREE